MSKVLSKISSRRVFTYILVGFTLAQISSFTSHVLFFIDNGYLSSPFFYVKSDTFMDLFHPMYWSDDVGKYNEWLSVYPPLVFIFLYSLKFFFIGDLRPIDAFELRVEGHFLEVTLLCSILFFTCFLLTQKSWKVFSRLERTLLFISFVLSAPMLFAIERGNTIILAFFLLAFAVGQNTSTLFRTILIAMLINIKPYFVILTLMFLVQKKNSDFLLCVFLAGVIFTITGALIDNSFFLFFNNLLNFSNSDGPLSLREIAALPSSISAYSAILSSENFCNSKYMDICDNTNLLSVTIEIIKWSALLMGVILMIKRSKSLYDQEIMFFILVLISNIAISVGGYSLIFYFAFLPFIWGMRFRHIYFGLLAVIFFSATVGAISSSQLPMEYSYLSDKYVTPIWSLDFNYLTKPIFNFMLFLFMMFEIYSKDKSVKRN